MLRMTSEDWHTLVLHQGKLAAHRRQQIVRDAIDDKFLCRVVRHKQCLACLFKWALCKITAWACMSTAVNITSIFVYIYD